MPCDTCGKDVNALFEMPVESGRMKICLSCLGEFRQQTQHILDNNERMINFLGEQIDFALGGLVSTPRFPPRIPPIQVPTTIHNVNVENSTVGNIITGQAENIAVTINGIRAHGENDLADAIQKFTEAVLTSEIEQTIKETLLECISLLADEAPKEEVKRKRNFVQQAIGTIKETLPLVGSTSSIISAWADLDKVLSGVFT